MVIESTEFASVHRSQYMHSSGLEINCAMFDDYISVIVPVFKVEQYLSKCIESIINQTYSNLDIILIDDGSPDHCGNICEQFGERDSRIRVFHTENHGLSAARNYGLSKIRSNSKWIAFVDSDDYIEKEMMEKLLQTMISRDADMVVCGYDKILNGEKKDGYYPEEEELTAKDALYKLVSDKINSEVWNKLYNRRLFSEIHFPEGRNYEDIATMHLLVAASKTVTTVEGCYYHQLIRDGSITHTWNKRNLIDKWLSSVDRYKYISSNYADDIEMIEGALQQCASSASRVWRWVLVLAKNDRNDMADELYEITKFVRDHFPLFGKQGWPVHLRYSIFFAHFSSLFSYACCYYANKTYIRLFPQNSMSITSSFAGK